MNFPCDNPLHGGFQYHSVAQNPVLAEAGVVLVIDSDVPWIPAVNRPRSGKAGGGCHQALADARGTPGRGAAVSSPDELPRVLTEALAVVRDGRSAVVSAQLRAVQG